MRLKNAHKRGGEGEREMGRGRGRGVGRGMGRGMERKTMGKSFAEGGDEDNHTPMLMRKTILIRIKF